jgi:hypothetical protein
METLDKNITTGSNKALEVNGSITSYVQTASKWTIIIAICLFVIAIVLIIYSVKSISDLSNFADVMGQNPVIFLGKLIAFVQLVFGAALILPGIFLIRFTISAKSAFRTLDQGDFDFAVKNVRNTFVFFAIYLITLLITIGSVVYYVYDLRNSIATI